MWKKKQWGLPLPKNSENLHETTSVNGMKPCIHVYHPLPPHTLENGDHEFCMEPLRISEICMGTIKGERNETVFSCNPQRPTTGTRGLWMWKKKNGAYHYQNLQNIHETTSANGMKPVFPCIPPLENGDHEFCMEPLRELPLPKFREFTWNQFGERNEAVFPCIHPPLPPWKTGITNFA